VIQMQNSCYLSVVRDNTSKTWKLGSNFLENYSIGFNVPQSYVNVGGLNELSRSLMY